MSLRYIRERNASRYPSGGFSLGSEDKKVLGLVSCGLCCGHM